MAKGTAKPPKERKPRSKATAAGKAPAEAPADPDALKRSTAGSYHTADGRFEVRNGGTGWFVVDTEQANDFGQELIHGPYPTLAAAREAIPGARSTKVTPIRRTSRVAKAPAEEPPPPPPSWIDRLPDAEARAVRAAIAALVAEASTPGGEEEAEALVRRDREGRDPVVAPRRIAHRLEAIVAELPERGRPGARELLRRAAEILTTDGIPSDGILPGWQLLEVPADDDAGARRIRIRELPAED